MAMGIGYGFAVLVSGMLILRQRPEQGILGLLLVLTTGPVALGLLALLSALRDRMSGAKLDEIAAQVRVLSQQAVLSDDARRVLNRQVERDALSRAIEEDISAGNWDAALVLVKELADRFGYRAEAEGYRARVEEARRQTREREITDAIALLDGLIIQRRWDDAAADAARLMRLYPDATRVEGLPARVRAARERYKLDLESQFQQAFREDRVDDALAVLKELDLYLTPEEAAPLREAARGVIGRARDSLGGQFRAAVQDRRWRDAEALGRRIVDQFPNSKMASEVRDLLDGIREKAAAG